jgi:predicted RNA binding protein YcfA (HicA-like mRNA interferase family)
MPKFPALTDKQIIKKLRKVGFRFYRYAKGNHEMWVRDIDGKIAIVPRHPGKIIKRKTLKDIIEATGLSINEFSRL